MRKVLFFFISLLVVNMPVYAQLSEDGRASVPCFENYYQKGMDSYRSGHLSDAVSFFNLAKQCKDCPDSSFVEECDLNLARLEELIKIKSKISFAESSFHDGNREKAAEFYFESGRQWLFIVGYCMCAYHYLDDSLKVKRIEKNCIYIESWIDSAHFCLKRAEELDKSIWSKNGFSDRLDFYISTANDCYEKFKYCLRYFFIRYSGSNDLYKDIHLREPRIYLSMAYAIIGVEYNLPDSLKNKIYKFKNFLRIDRDNVNLYIPKSENENSNTFVFIIDCFNYTGFDEQILSDASLFSSYCDRIGVIEDNFNHTFSATLDDLEEGIVSIRQTSEAYDGDLNIIFYYSGDAYTDKNSMEPYLIPVDGDSSRVETCFGLNRLVRELGSINAKSVLCFFETGFNSDKNIDTKPSTLIPKIDTPQGNVVLFTAASGSGKAYIHEDENHGLLTFYLAKRLQVQTNSLSLGELFDYVYANVKKYSFRNVYRIYNTEFQSPTVIASPSMEHKWRNIMVIGDRLEEKHALTNIDSKPELSKNGERKNSDDLSTSDSDIDRTIPQTAVTNAHTHVMIIANQNYSTEKPILTAINDGKLMKEYCVRTLGIPESQVTLLMNRTNAQMYGDVEDFAKTIRIHNDDNFLFFYFGHGMHNQDANTKDAYLIPVDGSSQRLERTGISRNWMMEQFSKSKPSQMVVYLESCFSGATSDNGMLSYSENSSGVRIKDVVDNSFQGNIVLVTASSQSETANALDRHNVFTYSFLKELQNSKGKLDWGSMFDKVKTETTKKAWDSLRRDQTPSITPSSTIGNNWRNWKLIPGD